jgi:hypothetical protein
MKSSELFVTRSGTDPAAYPSDGVAVSSTTTYYSKKISLALTQGNYSIQLAWTGTPTGAFTLWSSDEAEPSEADDTAWTQVTWTSSDPAGSPGKQRTDASGKGYRWLRIKYVNASGSGTVTGRATVH